MAQFYSLLILLVAVFLSLADADLRVRRSPQFSEASASAESFGNYPRGFGQSNFGPPRPLFGGPQFGGPHFGGPQFGERYPRGGPQFGGPSQAFGPQFGGPSPAFGPQFGGPSPAFGPQFGGRSPGFGRPGFGNSGFGRPGSGGSINISKSVSINTGGRGGGEARSSAGGFGK